MLKRHGGALYLVADDFHRASNGNQLANGGEPLSDKHQHKASRHRLRIFGPAVALTVLGFVVAYQFVDPAPPSQVSIASGNAGGAYYLFAQRYAEVLARDEIEVEVLKTAGSLGNIELLENGTVDVAFVQGGVGSTTPGLVSLASLYFEPVWIFYRSDDSIQTLNDLRGKRIATGAEGSGTRVVALELLKDNSIEAPATKLLPIGGEEAADALRGGRVDAAFLIASPASPTVRTLLEDESIALMSFGRAEAYTRIHHYLSRVILPEGVINMRRNIPDQDVVLLAPTANLVASPNLHPALIDLLLHAAEETHGSGGLFEKHAQFPAPEFLEFPLSREARRFFKSGPPFLQRFLPFWAAIFIDRMMIMLLPLVALAIPLFRLMPPVFRWRIRSRIYRWYRELLAIDPAIDEQVPTALVEAHLSDLDRIEREVTKVDVPLSYTDQVYHLRLHIELVREKLESALTRSQAQGGDGSGGVGRQTQ